MFGVFPLATPLDMATVTLEESPMTLENLQDVGKNYGKLHLSHILGIYL